MARSDRNPLARVCALLTTTFDDAPEDKVIWMPAHTAKHHVGVKRLGNGRYLTEDDMRYNDRADKLAKYQAATHAPHTDRTKHVAKHTHV